MAPLHAQQGFSATGGQVQGTGGTLSYMLGQVMFKTYKGSTGSISEGIQQTIQISVLGTEDPGIELVSIAYPNPTQKTLTLQVDNYNNEQLTYKVFDLQGQLLDTQPATGSVTNLDMKDLALGTYLLIIQEEDALIKTLKIRKY